MRTPAFTLSGMLAATVFVAAQTPASSPTPGTRDQPASSETVTVTGCLARGQTGAAVGTQTATPRAERSSRQGEGFVLSHAESVPAASASAPAGRTPPASNPTSTASTNPTVQKPEDRAGGTTYVLQGGANTDLTRYVNHKVQVTGVLESPTNAYSYSGSLSSVPGSTQAQGEVPGPAVLTLRVTSVKAIAGECE